MKKLHLSFFILIVAFVSIKQLNAQGTYCADADPFCTGTTYTFPNTYGTAEASTLDPGNNYGCLTDQPNPAWYYMEISTAGNLDIFIEQFDNNGAGLDVDFILYGPYNDLTQAMSYCGNHGNATTASDPNQIVDCSFDPDPAETANITGAQVGDVYLMLITNYSDDPGTISFSQSGGSGSTDCSIVFPPSCGVVDFHAEEGTSPYNTINPFPSTMTCEDDMIYLVANDSSTAGGYITPSLHFEFTPTNDPDDYVNIYSGGTGAIGSGTLIYNGPLNNGVVLTVYGDHLSPSTDYYFEICDETSVDYYIYDGGTGTIFDNGTDASGNGCTRFGPYSPSGSATWSTTAPPTSVGADDAGYAYFDPNDAGPGVYDFTYYWNLAGCSDSATKTITVTNPYTFTSLTYSTICKAAGGSVSASLTGTSGGTFSSSTLGASLDTVTGAVNIATAPTGTHTINYTVGTMPCGATGSGTITITPDNTVTPASSSPTLCINTAITPSITHTTTGATGIGTATGLPAGVSASFGSNTITISGTPTASGTFNYSIPLTGGCGTVSATGTIIVTPNNTASVPSTNPTVCINTTISPSITITTTGATGIGLASGLPAGVSASFSGNTITISGTPTASGTFSYSIPLTGGCGTVNATGTITVNPDPTVSINSASECENIPGSGDALNIDVTTLNSSINATGNITWFTDNTYGTSYNPINETVSDGEVFYFEVEINGCIVQDSIVYNVGPNIVLIDPLPEFCEDTLGSGSVSGVDLNTFNNAVYSGATTYTWAVGPTGVTINDGDSINVQVTDGGCPTVDIFVHFTVNPLPTATMSGGDTICVGDAIPDVTISLTGTSPWAVTYTDGTTPVTINPATSPVTLNGLSDGTYTITSVSDANCTGTFSGSATILTNPLPTATISGGGTICAGDTIPDVSIALTGASPWTITYTDGTTPVTINPTTSPVTLSGLADGTYSITSVSDANCTGTSSGSATILTNPLPTATISGGDTICSGDAIPDVTVTLTGTSPWSLTYTDGTTPVTINPTTSPVTLSGLADGTYTITAVSDANCTGTFSGSAIILTNPLPTATISGGGTICSGDTIPDVTISLTGTSPWTITYTDGTTPVTINSTTSPVILSGLADGTYTITSVSDTNCTGTFSGSATILTNPLPTAIDQTPQVCEDIIGSGTAQIDLTIYDTLIDGGTGTTVSWFNDSALTSIVATPTSTLVTNGQVFYVEIDNGTCTNTSTVTFTINSIDTTNSNASICQGDSLFVGGNWQTVAGIYYDTTTNVSGCDSILVTNLTIDSKPIVQAMNDTIICSGSLLSLTATTNGSGTIEWYSDASLTNLLGTGSPLTLPNPGVGIQTYYVIENGGACPSDVDSVTVTIGGVVANITATPSTGAIPLDVTLDGTASTGNVTSYDWNLGDGNTSNQPSINNIYTDIGTYTVTLIVSDGICSDTATVVIDAYGESAIIIPNVFTPNGDGNNDFFKVDGVNLKHVEGEIYNRWGQKMFAWDNVNGMWDGKTLSGADAPDGTYFYIIRAEGLDGKEYFQKGTLTLIR